MLRQSDLPEELSKLRDETIRDVLKESARDAKLKEALKRSMKPAPSQK